jgi:hypothetical protein
MSMVNPECQHCENLQARLEKAELALANEQMTRTMMTSSEVRLLRNQALEEAAQKIERGARARTKDMAADIRALKDTK